MRQYKITYYTNAGNTIVKSISCICKNDLEAFRFARKNKPSHYGFYDIEIV